MATSIACVRPATPADVSALMRLKFELALAEGTTDVVRASEEDWRRDAFGAQPRFAAAVAERDGAVVGMITCSEQYNTGWVGPSLLVQDLFVEPAHRRRGIGSNLLAHVAAQARQRDIALVALNIRRDNPARRLYARVGFQHVHQCLTYVIAGRAMLDLADMAGEISALM